MPVHQRVLHRSECTIGVLYLATFNNVCCHKSHHILITEMDKKWLNQWQNVWYLQFERFLFDVLSDYITAADKKIKAMWAKKYKYSILYVI